MTKPFLHGLAGWYMSYTEHNRIPMWAYTGGNQTKFAWGELTGIEDIYFMLVIAALDV